VIFKERLSVTGLNTAATLWCTAAVGALVGFGFIVQAAIGVAAVLTVHIIMRPMVRRGRQLEDRSDQRRRAFDDPGLRARGFD
jgi:uncharacterized membrane protein YhiD involved in acid resistance